MLCSPASPTPASEARLPNLPTYRPRKRPNGTTDRWRLFSERREPNVGGARNIGAGATQVHLPPRVLFAISADSANLPTGRDAQAPGHSKPRHIPKGPVVKPAAAAATAPPHAKRLGATRTAASRIILGALAAALFAAWPPLPPSVGRPVRPSLFLWPVVGGPIRNFRIGGLPCMWLSLFFFPPRPVEIPSDAAVGLVLWCSLWDWAFPLKRLGLRAPQAPRRLPNFPPRSSPWPRSEN